MKASVIIPTHNRRELLKRVLATYRVQDCMRQDFELLIVDDGSTDDTATLFDDFTVEDVEKEGRIPKKYRERILRLSRKSAGRYVQLRYVRITKSGRSIARNIGITLSRNPLIIFADDDIFVEKAFVRKHIECHTSADRTVVMGRVIHTAHLEDPYSARWKPKDVNTAFLATGNASVLKTYLQDAGLFDEGYSVYGWEDFDLGIHLSERGIVSIRKRIYGYHYDPPSRSIRPKDVYGKERERGISAVYFFKNHPLPWVRRFTLINNHPLKLLVGFLGCRNWFLAKEELSMFRGLLRLLIRYKGYFDGVEEGKRQYGME
jgi:glycosyltransferase involved in cell wall biosynthesis